MCNKCGTNYSTNIYLRQEEKANKLMWQNIGVNLLNNGIGLLLNGLGNINNSYDNTNVTKTENDDLKEEEEDQTKEEISKKVIEALGEDYFNGLPDDMKEDILNKSETYINILKLDGDAFSDRLKTYVKALNAHKIELKMAEYEGNIFQEALNEVAKNPEFPTSEELEKAIRLVAEKRINSELKIEDDDIEKQRLTGTDEEYYGAMRNRGIGYVDLYDTNGDEKVSLKEYKTFTEKEVGAQLDTEQEKMAEKLFNKIDHNSDNYITANEMASHLYAVSRMDDADGGPNTVSDITFAEWHDSNKILEGGDVSVRYDAIYKQLHNVLKP